MVKSWNIAIVVLLATVMLALSYAWGYSEAEAQSIAIQPTVTVTLVGEAPASGLAGMTIRAISPDGVDVQCSTGLRLIDTCIMPEIADYSFLDTNDDIQGGSTIDPLALFQFSGASGTHSITFRVTQADDDSGNPVAFGDLQTQITLP